MKFFYRAMPISADIIRPGDYITPSRSFAIEHAITSAIYHGEDYGICIIFLEKDDYAEALNPGEYVYAGAAPKQARLIGIAKYNNFTSNAKFISVSGLNIDILKVFGCWNIEI
jgi:hypothetical protein